MTEFDKLVTEKKIALADAYLAYEADVHAGTCGALYCAKHEVEKALAAKKEAERPKLLTAEEAEDVYNDHPSADCIENIQAVLTEERKQTLKVIEALPAKPVPDDEQEYVGDKLVKLSAIRTALLRRG